MNFWKLVLASAITAILGCASGGTRITATNNAFHTIHYEWVVPPERGWTLSESRGPDPSFVMKEDSNWFSNEVLFRIQIAEKGTLAERLRGQSAKFVADDYRQNQKNLVVENYAKTGRATLSEIEMGEIKVGDKTFWTVQFQAYQHGLRLGSHETLFLYLAKPSDNDHFLAIHYSEIGSARAAWTAEHKDDLMRILESVKAR